MSRYVILQPGGGGGAVTSVFGRAGAVAAAAGDYNGIYLPVGAGGSGQPNNAGTPRHCYGAGGTAAGSITVAGSGDWTIARSSTGVYVITFNVAFQTVPTVTVTLCATGSAGAQGAFLSSGTPAATGFTVLTEKTSAAADAEFHFTATAPA